MSDQALVALSGDVAFEAPHDLFDGLALHGAPGPCRPRVRGSWARRMRTMRHSAALACRSPPRLSRWRRCLPEEASTGLTPHSAANPASLSSRRGLSLTVTSRVLATWVATPCGVPQPR